MDRKPRQLTAQTSHLCPALFLPLPVSALDPSLRWRKPGSSDEHVASLPKNYVVFLVAKKVLPNMPSNGSSNIFRVGFSHGVNEQGTALPVPHHGYRVRMSPRGVSGAALSLVHHAECVLCFY